MPHADTGIAVFWLESEVLSARVLRKCDTNGGFVGRLTRGEGLTPPEDRKVVQGGTWPGRGPPRSARHGFHPSKFHTMSPIMPFFSGKRRFCQREFCGNVTVGWIADPVERKLLTDGLEIHPTEGLAPRADR